MLRPHNFELDMMMRAMFTRLSNSNMLRQDKWERMRNFVPATRALKTQLSTTLRPHKSFNRSETRRTTDRSDTIVLQTAIGVTMPAHWEAQLASTAAVFVVAQWTQTTFTRRQVLAALRILKISITRPDLKLSALTTFTVHRQVTCNNRKNKKM